MKIYLLIDYLGRFGSKHYDSPYRSGMDKSKLKKKFAVYGYDAAFIPFSQVDFRKTEMIGQPVVYTSQEDPGYYYKSFIEDIVYGLELHGAIILPSYKYLRANNNKVFMELLREKFFHGEIENIYSYRFGCLEELHSVIKNIQFPCVLKSSAGASGSGVFLVKNKIELIKKAKKISRTKNFFFEFWDWGREKKHKGYIRESKYRSKFIIQEFIPGLRNDWKIYIFGDKLFIFYRPILKGRGIKASGGGYENYFYGQNSNAPNGIFNFSYKIFKLLNVPHASMDIAFDGKKFYLIEFQVLYFGTAGIPYSDGYYLRQESGWVFKKEKLEIEKVYVESIVNYIKDNYK